MTIWKKKFTLPELEVFSRNTMLEHLDIRIIEIGDDYVKGSMPVDHRTRQPMGILHGGAAVALAETVGSIAGQMVAGADKRCVGLEINANHIRQASTGQVIGVARPIHLGRSTQVWDIRVQNEAEQIISICRLTIAVLAGAPSL